LFFDIGRNRIGIDPRQFPLRLNAAPPGFSPDLTWSALLRLRLDCFDVPACRALVRHQFRHRTNARDASDRDRAFAQARAVVRQVTKLGGNPAHTERISWKPIATITGNSVGSIEGFRAAGLE
jgi:hypothetical protein